MPDPEEDKDNPIIDGVSKHEPRGVLPHIADADKKVRTGREDEPVRNTPPAGRWNETSSD